jgi:uncharacterized protein YndB with AHSA1/START domain
MTVPSKSWCATVLVQARPERVLDALTDPNACARWSGVDFQAEELRESRLRTGSRTRVTGRLAGREVGFDLEIQRADPRRLVLCATGPVELSAEYLLRPARRGCVVDARVSVRPRRELLGLPSAGAIALVLSAGGLHHALRRLAREAEDRRGPEAASAAA